MIRKLRKTDIDEIADIWLSTNVETHRFIPAKYWEDNFASVKEMLGQAEVYVYEADTGDGIKGFIGMEDKYIAGIFIRDEAQSAGIGKQLLDYAKNIKQHLCLSVYQKNERAVKFYQRENFSIQSESTDENTGEEEYFMIWI